MVAAASDLLQEVGLPGSATTLSAPGYTIGNASITVGSTTNMPPNTGFTFAIDRAEVVNGEEVRIDGTYCEFVGTVNSSTQITGVSKTYGTAQDYSAGALTRVYIPVSSTRENRLVTWGLTHADQDGTLKAGAVDNVAVLADGVISSAAKFSAALNPETRSADLMFDHIASGCVWSGDAYGSTRLASCTSGIVWLSGKRLTVAAVSNRTFTASKDTYCDLHDNGDGTAVWVYSESTLNTASQALSAGNLRGGIIVTGASNIANVGSVNQGQEGKVLPIASSIPYMVTDSLGNLICPRDPQRKILGFRRAVADQNFTTEVEATALVVPCIVPTNRKVKVSLGGTHILSAGAAFHDVKLYDGRLGSSPTLIALQSEYLPGAGQSTTLEVIALQTPTTSSKTYSATLTSGSGTAVFKAGTTPGFVMVELV